MFRKWRTDASILDRPLVPFMVEAGEPIHRLAIARCFTRPPNLAASSTPALEVMAHNPTYPPPRLRNPSQMKREQKITLGEMAGAEGEGT